LSFLPDDPQINQFVTARDFLLTSLIVYGLSLIVALYVREIGISNGRYVGAFEQRIPPVTHWLKLISIVMIAVFVAHFVYSYARSVGGDLQKLRDQAFTANFNRQLTLSIIFATVGAMHSLAAVVILDMKGPQLEGRTWFGVIFAYISVMALSGFLIARFISSAAFRGEASKLDVVRMREVLYSVDLAMVALVTSLVLILLIRPRPPSGPTVPNPVTKPAREGAV
jgi:hypothetical protein